MTLKELIDDIKAKNGVLPVVQCAKPAESAMLMQMRQQVELLVANVQYVLDSVDEIKKARAKLIEAKAGEMNEQVRDALDYIDAACVLMTSLHGAK